jgi:CTP-dependent riboflavin kinase
MRVTGRVIHGTGAWKPRIERFPEVFIAHFGYPLFPGTLNVLIEAPLPVRAEFRIPGSEIGEPEQDMLFERCLVNGFEAFRLRPFQPATGVGGHGDHILEIVSAQELRPLLRDRDSVIVEFPGRQDRPVPAAANT